MEKIGETVAAGRYGCHPAIRELAGIISRLPRVGRPEQIVVGIVDGPEPCMVSGVFALWTAAPDWLPRVGVVVVRAAINESRAAVREHAGTALMQEIKGAPLAVAVPLVWWLCQRDPEWRVAFAIPEWSLRQWALHVGLPKSSFHDAWRAYATREVRHE